MAKPIISIEGLGKSYLVGHQSSGREQYTALRDVLGRTAKDFGRKAWDMARGRQIIQGDEVEEFWALKDVSFEVNQGEVVGIIGRNGAGKSTLLKVLSRITEPTKGKVTLRGRVASLLEVGTGFHPELSGRENIFLNGAILGMTRSEIKKKFDEIVDFAGVEKFLDTPVKRYSSGMYVRLAFAVAAHMEPEILIVDEVLAVGDVEFQKKCLSKMKDVATAGRTVLFVSHNLPAVGSLCSKGIILQSGAIASSGSATNAINTYRAMSETVEQRKLSIDEEKPRMTNVSFCEQSLSNGNLLVKIDFVSPYELKSPLVGIVVRDANGSPIFGHNTWMDADFQPRSVTEGSISFSAEKLPLHAGRYSISIYFGDQNENHHIEENYLHFQFMAPAIPQGISTSQIGSLRIAGNWLQVP